MSERDTRSGAKAKRAWGRASPTRGNFPADGVSRVACPCPSSLAPRQDVPGITLSSVKLKNPQNRCLGTMPFPVYRTDGKPSEVRILNPDHPIAAGVSPIFEIPLTEMYDEPFHVPETRRGDPGRRRAGGEWFRSGCVWTLGKGRVIYIRPGHETYPVFKQRAVLRILSNAVRWLA